jgi:hypothetical protein
VKKVVNQCLLKVRDLPLERFRAPSLGRKWKHLARQLQAMLVWLAGFANGDGTFFNGDMDYSPSVKRQMKHFGCKRHWIYKLQDYLRSLGFLSWTRANKQEGRKYTITIPDVDDSVSDVDDSTSDVDDTNPDVDAASSSDVDAIRPPSVLTVLPTVLPTVPERWVEELESLYGQAALDVTSGLSGKNIDILLARIKSDGWPLVKYAWELMLEIRSFEGLNKTTAANVFLKEYASWLMRAKKTPKLDLVAIQANIDRQNEETRTKNNQVLEEKHRQEELELANADKWLPR